MRHYDVAPNGLANRDARLRQLLAEQRYDSALARIELAEAAPDDPLLRSLYEGLVAHYAGAHERSAAAFQLAADLADDRYTKSVSRGALSLLTSDHTLLYEPAPSERMLLHFYAALGFLKADELQDAAVEARRLAVLLEASEGRDQPAPELRRMLRYFTGVIFEAAGERNDAAVAYRWAAVGQAVDSAAAALADTAPAAAGVATGEVVVILERGFIAHRVEEALIVALDDTEAAALSAGGEARAGAAAAVAARVLATALRDDRARLGDGGGRTLFVDLPPQPAVPTVTTHAQDGEGAEQTEDDEELLPYLLKVAWPAFRQEGRDASPLDLRTAAGPAAPLARVDVSAAVMADYDNERTLLLTRTIARAATKFVMTKSLEKKAGEKDAALGTLAGLLGNAGGFLSERADTRSWTLLPKSITITRLRLPAGEQTLWLGAGQPIGTAPTAPTANGAATVESAAPLLAAGRDIATVQVQPGRVTVVAARVWR